MGWSAWAAEPSLKPPGVMLRLGEWRGDVGTYLVPAPFEHLRPSQWPMDGWAALSINDKAGTLDISPVLPAEARVLLKPILDQVAMAGQTTAGNPDQPPADGTSDTSATPAYVRVPGLQWKRGAVPLHRFKNGTTTLRPELGFRFQLKLGELPYAFTLQNGLRTADGRPYGEGTQFTLEVDGQRYDYDLGGYGWDVTLAALGDFDGDGKPDFLFYLGGSNSSHEALVLSSQARPGRNAPTTYLSAMGC